MLGSEDGLTDALDGRNGGRELGRDEKGHSHPEGHGSNDHLASIYERQADQFEAVVPFIKQGLEQGERCLYVADDNPEEEVLEALCEGGVNVGEALESGALSIHTKADTYLRGGEFDTDKMLEFWQEALAEAKGEEDYTGLRAAAEMSWALDESTDLNLLVEYEALLNNLYSGEDYVILCQYSRERFPEEVLSEVIRSHPFVIYNGTVCENLHYHPPDEFFDSDRPPLDVDRTVEGLLGRAKAQQTLQKRERFQREFHEITTGSDLTFEEKVGRLLDLGRDRFGLDVGLLTRKEGEKFRIVAACGTPDVVEPGVTVVDPLADQYCRKTVTQDGPLCVEDAEAVGWDDDPLYREYGLDCYLGVKVTAGDAVYGTFCFAEGEVQKRPFTEAERTFLEQMGRWVSDELERIERKEELQRSKERFKRVFRGSHDPILIVDPKAGDIVGANPAASEMLGYSRDELLSLSPSALHPDEMGRFRRFVEGVFEEGSGWSDELTCQPKTGDPIPAEISASAIQIGGRRCMLALVRDISERKEHERFQRRLYEVAASTGRSFDQKLEALFDLGCEYFGLEVGGLAWIDPTADLFEVERTSSSHKHLIPGKQYPLSETYCRLVPGEEGTAAVSDPVGRGFEDKLCYEKFGVRAYLGTLVEVEGEPDRTFFFVSNEPKEEPFSETKQTFHHLMGQWVEYELNMKQREEELKELNGNLEARVEKRTRQVRELTAKVTLAEQRERDRIARLLHDGLQQRLYGSQLKISSLLEEAFAEGQEGLAGRLQKVEGEVEEITQAMRQLSVGMSPPVLEGDGLKGALEWLRSHMREVCGLEVELEAEREFRVKEEMRVLLFRATKKLLATIAECPETSKCSQSEPSDTSGCSEASQATVELREEKGDLVIEVVGEGEGGDLETLEGHEEDSLKSACERLRIFGGELKIDAGSEGEARAEIRVEMDGRVPEADSTKGDSTKRMPLEGEEEASTELIGGRAGENGEPPENGEAQNGTAESRG